MRVAIYVRVSTLLQAQAQTIEQQLERLRVYCQASNWLWQEENIFRDDGYSGAVLSRPGLDRLRDQVARANFDLVLLTAPDRLARNYVHQVLLIEELNRNGCKIEFADRPMSQDPHDQLLLQIRGAVSEYERTLIVERTRRGRLQKMRAGLLLPYSKPPYGYRLDPDHPRDPAGMRLDETQASMVVEMFDYYLEEGHNLMELARHLMHLEVPNQHGGKLWNPATIRNILTNPIYTGQIYSNRYRSRPSQLRQSPLKPVGRYGRNFVLNSSEDWVLVGQIAPLISQEKFELVKAKMGEGQAFARRNNKSHAYLLRALVSCGVCRLGCTGRPSGKNAYYTCRGKRGKEQSSREEVCTARLIPVKQLDEVVWQDVCEVISHPQSIKLALERAHGGHWLPQELQARRLNLGRAKKSLENQLERLTEAYLAGVVSLEEYKRRRQENEVRQQALGNQLRQLEVSCEQQKELEGVINSIESFCKRIELGLEQASFEQKRQLVELLIDRVVVTNEEVEIRYVIPTTPQSEAVRFCHLRKDYLLNRPRL